METKFDHLIFFPCIAQVSRFGQNLFSCIISYYVMHPIYDVSTGKLDRFDAFTKLKILKLITCNSLVSILMNLILYDTKILVCRISNFDKTAVQIINSYLQQSKQLNFPQFFYV